jgi:hypothetical protein
LKNNNALNSCLLYTRAPANVHAVRFYAKVCKLHASTTTNVLVAHNHCLFTCAMLQAVDDNTLLSHDDGIAAGQSYEKSSKTSIAVSTSKQQHVTATASSSNGSANGTDATLHTGNGTHAGSSNGTKTAATAITSTTTGVAGLGLKNLVGAHAATQVCIHLYYAINLEAVAIVIYCQA